MSRAEAQHANYSENADQKLNAIRMQGREVYKYAVNAMRKAAENVLDKSGMNVEDVNKLSPSSKSKNY